MASRPFPGSLPVRKLLVTRALEFLDKLAQEARNDRDLTLELAQAFLRIGEVQGGVTMASLLNHGLTTFANSISSDGLTPGERRGCYRDGPSVRLRLWASRCMVFGQQPRSVTPCRTARPNGRTYPQSHTM